MAVRNDITVDFSRSPRVATVAAPSVEVTMQDYVDTIRTIESSFQAMSFPYLIDASGKQPLGGGVFVGITVSQLNLKLAFEARYTPAQTGTVTTGSSAPVNNEISLIDAAATFITNGVMRGDTVINNTDGSSSDVTEVVSETELITKVPTNGTDNQYDIADAYKVMPTIQCTSTGGNLVGFDELGALTNAILPTAFTQVIQTTSSSATLQELTEIRYASYQNKVWYQASSGNSGVSYPNGTPQAPLNNIPDCVAVANALGFTTIQILGDVTFDTGDDAPGFTIIGQDPGTTTVTLNPGADVTNCRFTECGLTGTLDGEVEVRSAHILPPLNMVSGTLYQCLIEAGTITLSGTSDINFLDCWSGVAGTSTPIIDYNGSGRSLIMRNYSGGIQIINKTGADDVSVELDGGQIIIDSTVTDGTIVLYGEGKLTNNATGTTVVDTSGLLQPSTLLTKGFFLGTKDL